MDTADISSYFARAALAHVPGGQPRYAALLKQCGIDHDLLKDETARVNSEAFANLLRDTMLAMEDEQLGYGDAPQPLGSWSTAAQLSLGSETLGQALRRFARFYRLVPWGIETQLEIDDNEACFVMRPAGNQQFAPYLYESFLFYVYRFCNWLIDKQLSLIAVDFSYGDVRQRSEYRQLFLTSQFHFNQPSSRLRFARHYLDEPVRQDANSLKQFLDHPNLAMITQTLRLQSWQQRVEQVLYSALPDNPGIDTVAAALGAHPHTLRRHLSKEGLQFKEIKEQLRRESAIRLLSQSRLSVEEIAQRLGFSETSAFSRAFKQWEGVAPLGYRQRQTR